MISSRHKIKPMGPPKVVSEPSKKNCITACYPAGSTYIHPLSKQLIIADKNTCAIYPGSNKQGSSDNTLQYNQVCKLSDHNDHVKYPKDLMIQFDASRFLADVYGIHNLHETIIWTNKNSYLPQHTLNRIISSAWKAYIVEYDDLSDGWIDYYQNILLNYCENKMKKIKTSNKISNSLDMINSHWTYQHLQSVVLIRDTWSQVDVAQLTKASAWIAFSEQ